MSHFHAPDSHPLPRYSAATRPHDWRIALIGVVIFVALLFAGARSPAWAAPDPSSHNQTYQTATPTATITPTRRVFIYLPLLLKPPAPIALDLRRPYDVAVDPTTQRVYVTSRDNDKLFMLDGLTLDVLGVAPTLSQPWGVAVNGDSGKVYVASNGSGFVSVYDATTLTHRGDLRVGDKPTFVRLNRATNYLFVPAYDLNGLAIINGATDQAGITGADRGPWGLAVNVRLNRVYVGNREDGTIITFDGAAGFHRIEDHTFRACQDEGAAPYAMAYDASREQLYVACSIYGNINRLVTYKATAGGIGGIAPTAIAGSDEDGGGGVAVNPTTGHVFVTNSSAGVVNVISGDTYNIIGTVPVGRDPFGVAVDPTTGRVYVVNRGDNNLSVFADNFTR